MKELTKKESKQLYAGGGITAALINALNSSLSFFSDLGRYFGSAIRRIFDNDMCDY